MEGAKRRKVPQFAPSGLTLEPQALLPRATAVCLGNAVIATVF